mgnify:CR=1 FL=1
MVAVVVTVVTEGTVDVEAVEGLAVLARTPPGSASAPAKATTADGVVAVAAVPMAAAVATVPMAATVELVRCVALHCIPFHCVVMRAVVRRHGAGGVSPFFSLAFVGRHLTHIRPSPFHQLKSHPRWQRPCVCGRPPPPLPVLHEHCRRSWR